MLGLALILGFVFWIVRKQRFEQSRIAAQQDNMTHCGELQDYRQYELESHKVLYKREAIEIEAPPAELEVNEVSSPATLKP